MMHWLGRAKRWVQNPPPLWRVKLVLAVIAVCLLIYALEFAGFWPEALKTERVRPRVNVEPITGL